MSIGRDFKNMKFSIFLITLLQVLICESYLTSPLAIFVVFRHGLRTPEVSYPKDPYSDYDWPGGRGSLTTVGMKQMFELGRNLRKRYIKLIPEDGRYTSERLSIRSSSTDRTIASGLTFLAGFMPPLNNTNSLPIAWQPIPVRPIPFPEDYLILRMKPCPKYDFPIDLFQISSKDSETNKIIEGDMSFFQYLKNETGLEKITPLNLLGLIDALKTPKDNGLALPSWAEPIYTNKLLPLAKLWFNRIFVEQKSMQIKGTALLSEILLNFQNFINIRTQKTIFINSGHDITLAGLLEALGVRNQVYLEFVSDYAATIVAELGEMENNKLEIRFLYFRNSKDVDPIELKIPHCPKPCLLENFQLEMITDFDEVCKNGKR